MEKQKLKWKKQGISEERERIVKLIDEFNGKEFTDYEIWEEMKKELKSRIKGKTKYKMDIEEEANKIISGMEDEQLESEKQVDTKILNEIKEKNETQPTKTTK